MHECVEVAQRCHKAIHFTLAEVQPGQPSNNSERIFDEVVDLLATIELCQRHRIIQKFNKRLLAQAKAQKVVKIRKYMQLSKKLGALQ